MSNTDDIAVRAPRPAKAPAPPGRGWLLLGLAQLAVVTVLAVGSWWLLADPTTSPFSLYPLPFNAALFWAILFVVFVGFNMEFHAFAGLRQPVRGLVVIASTAVFAVAFTWLLGVGFGSLAPDFAAGRAGGLGWFTGALFVLFGFFTYVMVVVNWGHWPWVDLGLRQPLVGLCEIAFMLLPTLGLYLVIGLPAISGASPAGSSLMTLNTVLGWFYSIIVVTLLTGLSTDNWPWRLAGGGGRTALAATVGNIVLGSVFYAALLALAKAILGPGTVTELGDGIHQFPAQIGVCWAFWMIFWSNAFGNRPTHLSDGVNIAVRVALTFTLGVATFVGYYYVVAQHVLHEPVVAGSLHGNALGFLDWMVLWTLFYVVALGAYGLVRQPESEAMPVVGADVGASAQREPGRANSPA